MTFSETDVFRLIDTLYRSVESPDALETFLTQLRSVGDFTATALSFTPNHPSELLVAHAVGMSDEAIALQAQWESRSPFSPRIAALAPSRAVGPGEALVERRDLLQTPYFNEFLDRVGLYDSLAAIDLSSGRGIVSLAAFTPPGVRIDDDRVALVRRLGSHIFQAIDLQRQMAQLDVSAKVGRDALSRADFGCIFLDSEGEVFWMNALARELVSMSSAFELRDGRLLAREDRSSRRFRRAVRAALNLSEDRYDEVAPMFRIEKCDDGTPLEVLVSPLRAFGDALFETPGGAMVLVCDPDYVDEGFAARLEALHGLTPVQAEIAQWLLSGYSPAGIADVLGRSIHTVRNHLKRMFAKMGVTSQSELVALFQRSLARLR